jgi:gliding motility-associated-like protein
MGNENYLITGLNPINTSNPVGFSIFIDRACNNTTDGSVVFVNSNNIGVIGVPDGVNSLWGCSGSKGHFYYQNNTLFGLDDDAANNTMNGADALADISTYIINGSTTYSLDLGLNTNGGDPNINLLILNAYTTPCDTFTTTVTATQDTICLGDSVQLNATGGVIYNWFGAFGGLSDTSIANPMASPPQTTTYIVTIKNDSGCVKTEHIKIWVTQPIDSITTTSTICGNATGSIAAYYNTNANYNFTLYDNNFNLLTNNTTGIFNQLAAGTYIVENSLHNCTFYDTVTVNAVNNVMANFYNFPQAPWNNPNQALGKAPMEVSFFNTSQNANMYEWNITQQPNNDTIIQHSTFNIQHFFEEGGTYEVCLIAYNNQPQCADTVCKTIFIDPNEEISLFIPNVFTPNGDNENDNFVIQLIGAEYLERLEVEVFNRWGQRISNYELEIGNSMTNLESPISNLTVWNGTTNAGAAAPEGTYFYVVSYKTKAGETVSEKGTVSLLR